MDPFLQSWIDQYGKQVVTVTVSLSIFFGLLTCFYGYRIFKIVLLLGGFLAGFVISSAFISVAGGENTQIESIIYSVLGGTIGTLVFSSIYFLGVFLLGAIVGSLIGSAINSSQNVVVIGAVIGGIFAILAERTILIIFTSVSGAIVAVNGAYFLFYGGSNPLTVFEMHEYAPFQFFLISTLLSFLGMAAQYTWLKKLPPPVAQSNPYNRVPLS